MQFGIIYSIEVYKSEVVLENCRPPAEQRKEGLWEQTEKGDSEYNATLDTTGWLHEKWCACLTLEQMDELVKRTDIVADSTETMGSLGAPQPDGTTSWGCSPAVSFQYYDNDCDLNAYVTPYPEADDPQVIEGLDLENLDGDAFQLVKEWMLDRWGRDA